MARDLGKNLSRARIIIALIGLATSVYLALIATFGISAACPAGQIINCDAVLGSAYARTFGVPNGYLGIAFFIAALALIYLKKTEPLVLVNAVGSGFVAYFVYAEYMIGSICIYCTLVHICTLLLLAISLYELRGAKGT